MPTAKAWTTGEVRRLRELLAAGTVYTRAAELLGRSRGSVFAQVRRSGCGKGLVARTAARRKLVKRLHATGLDTTNIGRRVGACFAVIQRDLAALGLAGNKRTQSENGRMGKHAVENEQRRPMWQMRVERERIRSVGEGWPPVSTGLARYLDAFYKADTLTPPQLIRAVGTTFNAGAAAVRKLLAAGYIERVSPPERRRRARYRLAADVREGRDRVLAYRAARDLINCPRVGGEYTGGVVTDPRPRRRK